MELMPDVRPTQATLVPDMPGAVTSDHGWDLNPENCTRLIPIIKKLKSLGIRVSLFVDPVIPTVEMAKKIGADRIELYTEPYASAFSSKNTLESVTAKFAASAAAADKIGLGVNAGHDLNLDNLGFFCKNVKPVMEVSIGHALIADAIDMGLAATVKAYIKILDNIS
jgi:pyridoxine 5-phosphate synthase